MVFLMLTLVLPSYWTLVFERSHRDFSGFDVSFLFKSFFVMFFRLVVILLSLPEPVTDVPSMISGVMNPDPSHKLAKL
jgi:hypothetical protein